MAGRQDRHPMAAQIAAHEQLIAGADRGGINRRWRLHHADAAGGDEHPVGLAPLHHLGVAGDDREAALLGRRRHRGHQTPQQRQLQPLLQDQAHTQVVRPGPGHGQVVGGAGHRQAADVAAGKFERLHHVAVGAEGQRARGELEPGGIVQHLGRIGIEGPQLLINQLLHPGAAAAVGQLDALAHGHGAACRR